MAKIKVDCDTCPEHKLMKWTTRVAIGSLAVVIAVGISLHWRISGNDKELNDRLFRGQADVSTKLTEIATQQRRVLTDVGDVGVKVEKLQERVASVETEVKVHTRETAGARIR